MTQETKDEIQTSGSADGLVYIMTVLKLLEESLSLRDSLSHSVMFIIVMDIKTVFISV